TKASGEQVAREFGIARVYGDWRELVRAPDLDAVCIGTWPNTHCEITRAVLEQGKHVLCEARMAMNVAEARSMLEAARRAPQLVKQLVPAPNTLEVDSTVQKLLADGYVGEVLAVEIQASQGRFVDAEEPLHWRQDAVLSGLNVMTMGIWDEALSEIVIPAERRIGWRVEEEFVNAIRGKEKVSRTTFEDGVRYMEFTEAVWKSAAGGGQAVEVAEL